MGVEWPDTGDGLSDWRRKPFKMFARIYKHNNIAVYVVHDSDIRHAIHVHIGAYVVSWFVILARRQN